MVLTTKLLEDVVQGHSNQVKDLIEAQKCTIHNSSKSGLLNCTFFMLQSDPLLDWSDSGQHLLTVLLSIPLNFLP